jgi:hypothetical protein
MRQGRSLSSTAWLARLLFSMDHRVKPGGDEMGCGAARATSRGDIDMPSRRRNESSQPNEPPAKQDFLKRRTFEEGRAQVDAAHSATHRLYCDALRFWRRCAKRPCKRHRRCTGEPTGCLMRGLPSVPQAQRLKAQKEVIAGGPRRMAPATHIEWFVRRTELATLVSWGFG